MKLDRITLENFRQYFGRQRLNFARDEQRRVTVIHGINGAGKTSLFLAINWCLYGRSVDSVKVIDNVGELISKEAISQAVSGELVRTSIELSFLHNEERYLIRRSLQGLKQSNENILVEQTDNFTMMCTSWDGQAKRVSNPIGTINAILPSNARTYFLFDGEKIDNFAKPEAAAEVKKAVYLVLKLEILERARRHLDSVAQDYRKKLKQISGGELRDLIEKDEQARSTRKQANKRRDDLQKEIESARRKIADIDEQLRNIQNAKALQQQRDRIEQDLSERQAALSSTSNNIRNLATGAYFILAQPALTQAL